MRKSILIGIVLVGMFIITQGQKTEAVELKKTDKEFYGLTEDIVTPHIAWAKPYEKGKIKALIIAPAYTQRETIELAQRLDMDYVTVFSFSEKKLGIDPLKAAPDELIAGMTIDEKESELKDKLKETYDVIIIGSLNWDVWTDELKLQILTKVKEGTGLVFGFKPQGIDEILAKVMSNTTTDESNFIKTGIPFGEISVFDRPISPRETIITRTSDFLKLSTFGKGRIVLLDYLFPAHWHRNHCITPVTSYNPETTMLDYEYFMSLVIKAALWAAQKEPSILINEMAISNNSLQISFNSSIDDANIQLQFVIRDKENQIEFEKLIPFSITQGENAYSFEMPFLKRGVHFVDLFIKDKDKTINWGTYPVKTTSSSYIERIAISKDSYDINEELEGKVTLKNNPGEPLRLEVQIWDNHNRLLSHKNFDISTDTAEISFDFNLRKTKSRLNKIKAILFRDQNVIDTRTEEFGVPMRNWDDFLFIVWNGYASNDYVKKQLDRRIYELGADAVVSNLYAPHLWDVAKSLYEANLEVIPYSTRFADEATDPYHGAQGRTQQDMVRRPCLNDPAYRAKVKEEMEGVAHAIGKYGPPGYSLGDEGNFIAVDGMDLCFCQYCNADFILYVKKEYGQLEALNKEWGTEYTDWQDVKPMTIYEAKRHGNFAPWVDHRRHMDETFAGIHAYSTDILLKSDKYARAGGVSFTVTPSKDSATDWWKMMSVCQMMSPYSCSVLPRETYPWRVTVGALVRSFKKRDSLTIWIYGGYFESDHFNRTEDVQRWSPWASLFNGDNAALWFHSYDTIPVGAVSATGLAPDFTPYPIMRLASEEIGEIKSGVGKLLLNSVRMNDGVGIHYSQSSIYASAIDSQLSQVLSKQPYIERYIRLLEDLGLNYEFVSYEQVEEGELLKKNYKVLLLPYSQAMSDKEVKQVEEFVSKGGMVIADFRPAVMDEHCKLLDKGALDQVFGIKREKMEVKRGQGQAKFNDGEPILVSTRFDTNIEPTTSKAYANCGNSPAVMVNQYGKGRAVYLNLAIDSYDSSLEDNRGEGMRSLMRKLFRMAKVENHITITSDEEKNLRALQRVSFVNGDIEYLGLLRDIEYLGGPKDKTPKKIEFKFPKTGHLYDIRDGKYYGFTDSHRTEITPARAKIYALVPYRIEAINMEGIREDYNEGDVVDFTIGLKIEGSSPLSTHAVRIEIYGPDGEEYRYYSQNVLMDKNDYKGKIELALNEKPGTWKVIAREIISGKTQEKKFEIRSAK